MDNIDVTNKYQTMQKLTQNQETEIIATIDELNQYRNGNVTDEGILDALESLIGKIYASVQVTKTIKL